MAKLKRSNVFTTSKPRPETQMDKTTRVVKQILDGEKEHRQIKTARLREARLERKASRPGNATASKTGETREKQRVKAAT
jgi:hypothetical protein